MSNDTKTRPAKPPEKKIGPFASGIGVAIWLNETESDDGQIRHFRSVTLNPRRYFDSKSGQWKDASSYQQSDLPGLIFSLQKGFRVLLRDAGSRPGKGRARRSGRRCRRSLLTRTFRADPKADEAWGFLRVRVVPVEQLGYPRRTCRATT